MEAGVRKFGDGLIAAIQARAGKAHPVDIVTIERTELDAFSSALADLDIRSNNPRKIALEGLTNFVRGLIHGVQERLEDGAEGADFYALLRQEIDGVAALILPLENAFQAAGPVDLKQKVQSAADWVSQQ